MGFTSPTFTDAPAAPVPGGAVVPVTAAKLTALGTQFVQAQSATLKGKQFVNGCYTVGRSSLQTTTGTSRAGFQVMIPVTDLRMVFGNATQTGTATSPNYTDVDSTSPVVVSASWEIGGTLYPATVGGRLSWSVDGGGIVQTDPLPVELAADAIVYVRTFVSGSWYPTRTTSPATTGGDGGWVVTSNLTPVGSGAVADSANSFLYLPIAMTGTPLDTAAATPVVMIIGDSLAQGTGDGGYAGDRLGINIGDVRRGGGGYIWRALQTAHIPSFNAAQASDLTYQFILPAGRFRRLAFAADASTVICEYGRNDVSGGRTLAQCQAALITAWQLRSRQGTRVIQTTITPVTTSTDGWWTTANQTATATESVRVALNTWIRDGAPILNGVAVASGSSATGTLRAGASGHPLFTYFEVTDIAETARNSGIWKAPVNSRTITDGVATASSFNFTSATAAFTQADVGSKVRITGAGTAGADYYNSIAVVVSATTITLQAATPTSVNPATASIADSNTVDGTHPGSAMALLLAAGITTGSLL